MTTETCTINDRTLIDEIKGFCTKESIVAKTYDELKKNIDNDFEHPVDKDVIELIASIAIDKNEINYKNSEQIDQLWGLLLEKSIKCLRFFDTREPFLKNENKIPVAYGIKELKDYHRKYTEFEGMLYGSNEYYRDHVFHSVRTWMLGIFCLLTDKVSTNKQLVELIIVDGEKPLPHDANDQKNFSSKINFFEKVSMWTITSLCHDLGYPLEKSQKILEKTREMMGVFVANPKIWNDLDFSGIQDNINEYIVKFMSSKMKLIEKGEDNKYLGRIQPKYYLKFTKSLEKYGHGIVSTVIIYKMLLYFIESDYNLNDDYEFKEEDARQFYIRREILRAISAHTCPDIYHIRLNTLSSLLIVCDELQEWGRKAWKNIYTGINPNAIELQVHEFSSSRIKVTEVITMNNNDTAMVVDNMKRVFDRQYNHYRVIFRDGQFTDLRDFDFCKTLKIVLPKDGASEREIIVEYSILHSDKDEFLVDVSKAPQHKNEITEMINKFKEKYPRDVIKCKGCNK